MSENYNKIIKHIMELKNIKQKDLAVKLNESQQNMSNMLNRNDMTLTNFIRICDAIDINPADIFNKTSDTSGILDPRWVSLIKEADKLDDNLKMLFLEHTVNTLRMLKMAKSKSE